MSLGPSTGSQLQFHSWRSAAQHKAVLLSTQNTAKVPFLRVQQILHLYLHAVFVRTQEMGGVAGGGGEGGAPCFRKLSRF